MNKNDALRSSGDSETGGNKTVQSMDHDPHLADLFDSYPDGFIIIDGGGKIISYNAAFTALTGYGGNELSSMHAVDLFKDELSQRIFSADEKTEDRKRHIRFESACIRKNDSVFPAELTVIFSETGVSQTGFVFIRDISSIRAESEKNRKLKDRFRHAQTMETVGQLAGGISHYFNNVFTGIMGNLGLAETDAPENIVHFIRLASNAADRARGFTRQLLSLSRKSQIVPEPADISAIIDDVHGFTRLAFDRHIEITVEKPVKLPGVLADSAAIHHVILNLCVNARDAIEEKRRLSPDSEKSFITIEAAPVTVSKQYAGGMKDASAGKFVKISVSDTGCGIDGEIRKRLFEPFFTTKEHGKGTGLGLSTAHETIVRHGGWIELSSVPGKGSTFTFYLPAVSFKKKITAEVKTDDLPGGSETILFVDDEEMVRTFALAALERLGYSVIGASDGSETVDVFIREHGRIDLVVLDLGLPLLPGREVLQQLRKIDRNVRVIISTGHDFERNRNFFDELRALDYILKPFNIGELALSVRNALDRNVI